MCYKLNYVSFSTFNHLIHVHLTFENFLQFGFLFFFNRNFFCNIGGASAGRRGILHSRNLQEIGKNTKLDCNFFSSTSNIYSFIHDLETQKNIIINFEYNIYGQVAIKALIVIHRTLREGDPTFREELMNFSFRGHILQISNFKDDSSPLGN